MDAAKTNLGGCGYVDAAKTNLGGVWQAAGGSTVQHDLNAPPSRITVNRRILQTETEGTTSAGECHPELPHAALQH